MNGTRIETSDANLLAVPAFGPVPPIVIRRVRRSGRPLGTRWLPSARQRAWGGRPTLGPVGQS
jgi:hypothetical protein